jgi:ribosomal protein S18 acetylase RimI-like enzyme
MSKNQCEYSLRPATQDDLTTVLPWVTCPAELTRWGGPLPTWPPDPQKTWREIQANDPESFVLVDRAGAITAFGQTFVRNTGTVHLGRIIVSPAHRGKGLGRLLVELLMQTGIENHHPTKITLNVFRDNGHACSLYKSLGFEVVSEDTERNVYGMSLEVGQTGLLPKRSGS